MLNIGKKYCLDADSQNFILRKRVPTKKGEEVFRTIGYFPTVQSALHELLNLKIREIELKDLKTIIVAIEETKALINALPTMRATTTGNRGDKPSG